MNRADTVYGVNKINLIFIPCAPQLLNCQQQPLKFVLFNARSICRKTLLVNDYILERDIDLLAITETWLHGDFLTNFIVTTSVLRDIELNTYQGIMLKVEGWRLFIRNVSRSFEFMDINITPALIQNLRLAVIYRAPPSPENGFMSRTLLCFFWTTFLETAVYSCTAVYGYVYPCTAMYIYTYPCKAVYGHVCQCIPMYIRVQPCTSMFSRAQPCMSMYSHVYHPYISMYCRVWPCRAMYTYVYPYIPM